MDQLPAGPILCLRSLGALVIEACERRPAKLVVRSFRESLSLDARWLPPNHDLGAAQATGLAGAAATNSALATLGGGAIAAGGGGMAAGITTRLVAAAWPAAAVAVAGAVGYGLWQLRRN